MRTTKKLYQWDTDQKLFDCDGKYVDFPIGDEVYRIEVIDKECIIPDELLQVSGTVKVYECTEYGTVKAFAFYINPRPKPPDYVFTPTQRLTFEGLVKKVDETIADLQKRADSGEFNGRDYVITESDYDAIAAKTAGKLQPTIGELARTLETEKTDRERADISLQKDISGKLSEPVEGLAVGKYFRVAQIDENGHAVLEAVDAPKEGLSITPTGWPAWTAEEQAAARERIGASKKLGIWEDIATVNITEDAAAITVNLDANGNTFSLSDIICEITIPAESPVKQRSIYFGLNILANFTFSRIALTTNERYISGAITYARIVSGRVICDGAISGPSNTRHQPYYKYAIFNGHGGIEAESFDSVSVFTYSDAFPAGTTVILKGIRT